jgi:BASS family bile acid:Na+ symporter
MTPLLQAIGSAALVVSLMLAIGLELDPSQLSALATRRAMLVWTTIVNVLVIPALAWAAVLVLALPSEVVIGVLLCAAAPGGPTSALYSNTARADLPLAAAMTILLPAIGVVTTPLLLSVALELPEGASMPVAPMIGTLIVLQLVPLALGMSVRRWRPRLAKRLAPFASGLANAILAALVIGLGILQGELMLGISGPTWAVLIGVTVAALGLGYVCAHNPRPGPNQTGKHSGRAGALVAGCRNVSVAIMLASTFFSTPVVEATVLAFGLVTFLLPLGLALWWRARG